MGKIMTLRGVTDPTADNGRHLNFQIFSFEANVLERGWIVRDFYFWPADVRANTGSTDGQFQIAATLTTDEIPSALGGFDDLASVRDNRTIAWMQKGYNRRNSAIEDFITSPTGLYYDNKAIIDPDHLVNDALYINFFSTSDSTTSPQRVYNYMVVLEEVKVTPAKAILSLLKGKGQDLGN